MSKITLALLSFTLLPACATMTEISDERYSAIQKRAAELRAQQAYHRFMKASRVK